MMNYFDLYRDLLNQYFDGRLTREDLVEIIVDRVPIDVEYPSDGELLSNCEWGLRHATHPGFFSPERELRYYHQCLLGAVPYSNEARDAVLLAEEPNLAGRRN